MRIDINRARELSSAGYRHKEIGQQLALEQERRIRYTAAGVAAALRRARKEEDGKDRSTKG